MHEAITQLNHWHWWILGVILVGLEIFAPMTVFLWFGISAGVTGFILLIVPDLSWENQFLLFSILSLVSVSYSLYYLKKNPIKTDQPRLNRRGEQLIGRTFNLETPIENGTGKIRADDTYWRVESDQDCDQNHRVKVISTDGAVLKVEVL